MSSIPFCQALDIFLDIKTAGVHVYSAALARVTRLVWLVLHHAGLCPGLFRRGPVPVLLNDSPASCYLVHLLTLLLSFKLPRYHSASLFSVTFSPEDHSLPSLQGFLERRLLPRQITHHLT